MSKQAPTIAEFMTRSTLTISHSASLNEAHELMRRHQIRHLPVVSQNEVIGVVSIRDLHLIETFDGVDRDRLKVREAMSTPVFTVDENDPINEVAAKMADTKLGSALVVDSENMVSGIFTVTDGLRALSQAWDD